MKRAIAWLDRLSLMTGGHRRSARTVALGFLVFAVVMHGLAYLMLSHYDNLAGTADTQILVVIAGTLLMTLSLMLSPPRSRGRSPSTT